MKVHLMFPDRDVDPATGPPANAPDLIDDLGLDRLLDSMGGGDGFVRDISQRTLLVSLDDWENIIYRQQILTDCLKQPEPIHRLYDLAVETIESGKKIYHGIFNTTPDAVLRGAIESLELMERMLKRLRRLADQYAGSFSSPGFKSFFAMIVQELDEAYFQEIAGHFGRLKFRGGPFISAGLGTANQGNGYVLRKHVLDGENWVQRLYCRDREAYSFRLDARDDRGFEALGAIRARGLNEVANALAQSDDHIMNFFTVLRTELGFYLGCMNLHRALEPSGGPICLPQPCHPDGGAWVSARGLYDASLALAAHGPVVGNNICAKGKSLVIITGANEGGKSTFLRGLGIAQLMMHCGMFVCADVYRSGLCAGLYTHYKREEDVSLTSGKLDEELVRMSRIAKIMAGNSVVLFNESFSATNEREGSAIALDIIRALVESGLRVVFVTHFFEMAHTLYGQGLPETLFLQAERRDDGVRTFQIVEAEPVPTSHGVDLYDQIFPHAD